MSINGIQSNDPMKGGFPLKADGSADVPEWLVVQQDNQAAAVQKVTAKNDSPRPSNRPSPAVPPPLKSKRGLPLLIFPETTAGNALPNRPWFTRLLAKQGAQGILISLAVHVFALASLAFIAISNATSHDHVNLFGVLGGSDEIGSELFVDTSLPSDGGESAQLSTESVLATELSDSVVGVPETIRTGFGGKGHGLGDAGEGNSIGLPSLRVPGHAQTKGSFSAWTDPKDPLPNEDYRIVIQIRLPVAIRKYRASDLSGSVTGTDRYRQKIPDNTADQFPVENGVAEIRIRVPGGEKRVRDTIQISSKILNEKQTFEIEF